MTRLDDCERQIIRKTIDKLMDETIAGTDSKAGRVLTNTLKADAAGKMDEFVRYSDHCIAVYVDGNLTADDIV